MEVDYLGPTPTDTTSSHSGPLDEVNPTKFAFINFVIILFIRSKNLIVSHHQFQFSQHTILKV